MTVLLLDVGGPGTLDQPLPTPRHHTPWSSPTGASRTPGDGLHVWPSTTP